MPFCKRWQPIKDLDPIKLGFLKTLTLK
jgi:hypothetical protein